MAGQPQRRTREALGEIERYSVGKMQRFLRTAEITPMEVMYCNMRYMHEKAQILEDYTNEKAKLLLAQVGEVIQGRPTVEQMAKIIEMRDAARDKAQDYARDI